MAYTFVRDYRSLEITEPLNNADPQESSILLWPRKTRRSRLVVPLVALALGAALILTLVVSLVILVPRLHKPPVVFNTTTYDLNGNWRLQNSNASIEVTALVPESVHSALHRAHVIGDPYWRFNDVRLSWVYQNTWIYAREFTGKVDFLPITFSWDGPQPITRDSRERTHVSKTVSNTTTGALHLICEGLDTIATININGVKVGEADNQFLRYIYDITSHVKVGEKNTVTITFSPPVEAAESLAVAGPAEPSACDPKKYPMECHVNMIRKSQASFGWRWSPVLPTQGIWKDIYLVEFSTCRVLDIITETFPVSDAPNWDLHIETHIDCVSVEPITMTITWELMDNSNTVKTVSSNISMTLGEHSLEETMTNLLVRNWWPRKHGEQKLYTLNVIWSALGELPKTKTVRVGFRTVTLVEDALDDGYSFHFLINGRPIFLKGSTWIPTDVLQGQVDKSRIRGLLQSAVDANMNVLRVPGSAVYESDYFYDLADEYGLMVWQDFMFSSALYPGDSEFIDLIRREINYQLWRLVHHPCIIAWAGNDNVERAIVEKWFDMDGPYYEKYLEDYQNLFTDVLRTEVRRKTSVPYLTSSPSNGKLSLEQGGISMDPGPNSPYYGDIHSHQFLEDCMDLRNTSAARLVSNYGWGSWPTYHSLLKVANPSDLVYDSEFFNHREHNQEAANGMDRMIHRYFNWSTHLEKKEGFKHYIYLTQLVQTLCLKSETEYYRRMRASGTMGSILWQLNDLWTAPSGATLEQDGTWKMAHYHAVHAMSDVLLVVTRDGDVITGYIINDSLQDIYSNRGFTAVYSWDQVNYLNGGVLFLDNGNFTAQNVTKVFEDNISTFTWNCEDLARCFVTFEVYSDDISIPKAFLYLTPFKESKGFLPTNIDPWLVEKTGNNTFDISLSCENSSPFVWADAGHIRGWFSVNGVTYDCLSMPQAISFHALSDSVTADALKQSLSFMSLADVMLAL